MRWIRTLRCAIHAPRKPGVSIHGHPCDACVAPLSGPAPSQSLCLRCGLVLLSLALFLAAGTARAERVEDLATVAGVRSNQLIGYGLVVGLDGTGDQTSQTPFTIQSIENMLAKFGVTVPANTNPMLKNVAAVTVHATLPPFSKPGQ